MFQFNVMTQIGFKHVLLQSWLLNLMLFLWSMIKSTFLLPKNDDIFFRLFSKIELFGNFTERDSLVTHPPHPPIKSVRNSNSKTPI